MDNERAVEKFKNMLADDPDLSPAVAALQVLMDFMNQDTSSLNKKYLHELTHMQIPESFTNSWTVAVAEPEWGALGLMPLPDALAETIQGLEKSIKSLVEALNTVDFSVTSVKSACELFMRFITLASLDHSDIKECKRVLSLRAVKFLHRVSNARTKIAKIGEKFIFDDQVILIHSHSRVVYQTLVEAHASKKRFHVYITESAPDFSGKLMYEKLEKAGLSCTLILDAAVSYVLEKVDLVFLGAEGVAESGGIINKIGTYNIAICAKAMHKPVYVLAESFKFLRIYPLNQRDLPNELKHLSNKVKSKEHPLIDYTPPSYITLLFSDLGILDPSAVSDELISLYV